MKIKVLKDRAKEMEIEVESESENLLNPLKEKLLEMDEVVYAEYYKEHPLLSNPKIYVKTKKERPREVIKRALRELYEEVKSFREQVEKVANP